MYSQRAASSVPGSPTSLWCPDIVQILNSIKIENWVFEQINTLNWLCLSAPLQGVVPEWELPRGYRVHRSNIAAGSHETAG